MAEDAPRQAAGVGGRLVLVAGATSASGEAATRALVNAGARVVAVGRDEERLASVTRLGARAAVCDLTDEHAVRALAAQLAATGDRVDGVLHLVGGWRGGGGFAGQTDDDYRFLEKSLTAWRHLSRAFWDDLVDSASARVAVVSSTAVVRPLAGGANYAAVKAATEAWTRALAHGFTKTARDAGEPLRAAAVVFRVKTLAGREADLASAFVHLWDAAPDAVNDTVVTLAD